MPRKAIALLTLAAFVAFSTSCATWKTQDLRTLARPLPENTLVLSVVMSSGEVVQFSKAEPGRVRGFTVVGRGRVTKQREIVGPFPSVKKGKDGRIYEVTDAGGHVYSVQTVLSQSEARMSLVGGEWVQTSIPLSEVCQIGFKKADPLLTALVILGCVGVAIVGLGIYLHVTGD